MWWLSTTSFTLCIFIFNGLQHPNMLGQNSCWGSSHFRHFFCHQPPSPPPPERQVGEAVVPAHTTVLVIFFSSWEHQPWLLEDVLLHLHRSPESRHWICLAKDESVYAKVSGVFGCKYGSCCLNRMLNH